MAMPMPMEREWRDETRGRLSKRERALYYIRKRRLLSLEDGGEGAAAIEAFGDAYRCFVSEAKTPREVCTLVRDAARNAGFRPLEELEFGELKPGTRVYQTNRGCALALAVIGDAPLSDGANLVATHTDAPRLDCKPVPLREDEDAALLILDTHYYGGIRKYHWTARPLALHGTVLCADGTTLTITVGEAVDEPAFVIPDLASTLATRQDQRRLVEGVAGEELDALASSRPAPEDKSGCKTTEQRCGPLKRHLLSSLYEKYRLTEEDLVSAELILVPAGRARDVGLDRSMIGAYGHDNRVSVYPALRALLDLDTPDKTALALFFDREEIGSYGATGARSMFMETFYAELLAGAVGADDPSLSSTRALLRALRNTNALCCDVKAGVNPNFKNVQQATNAAKIGYGVTLTKYTGARGKLRANDADAEYVGRVRRVFNAAGVHWQPSETGKVDEGGGGTVAKFLAQQSISVIDIGIPLLSMHAPFEVVSKSDVHTAYCAYRTFFEDMR